MATPSHRANVARHEAALVAKGIKKITFRLDTATRLALSAKAQALGIAENECIIRAIAHFTQEPTP